jgi:antitoxin VapB
MNIKDPEVHRLARTLAQRRGTSMTGAIRAALEAALERDRSGVAEALMALARRYEPEPGYPLKDEDLYDERGLPW